VANTVRAVRGDAKGKLVQVCLAENHRPGCPQAPHRFGVALRNSLGKRLGPIGGDRIRDGNIILYQDRHAIEQQSLTACAARVHPPGICSRLVGRYGDERIQNRLIRVYTI
jgi:hypothetical protein